MPNHKKMTSARIAGPAKAGKRAGRYTAPPEPNLEKQEAREAGERQFCLARPATVEVANLMGKLEAVTVPYTWDAARKHVCFSPVRKHADR